MHESSSSGSASKRIKRDARHYSASHYLVPTVPRGVQEGDVTCQDLESLTFANASFDLFVTQDVLEHVLRPERALQEIARVLRPGGMHVFTVLVYRGRTTLVRVVPTTSGIQHLEPPDYHENPVDPNGSLVIREWGDDFIDFVKSATGLDTEALSFHDRPRGLDGEFLEVFITRK